MIYKKFRVVNKYLKKIFHLTENRVICQPLQEFNLSNRKEILWQTLQLQIL